MSRDLEDTGCLAALLSTLGQAVLEQGDAARARALQAESLTLDWERGDALLVFWRLEGLARMAGTQGQATRAARLFGAAEALRESIALTLPLADYPIHERHVATARAQLGEATFLAAWTAGGALPLAVAIAEALAVGDAPARPLRGPRTPAALSLPGSATAPLNQREREVVALIARGRTNRQIATVLEMAGRTADTHVSHILRKLGVNSRAEVVAWAVDQGLLAGDARLTNGEVLAVQPGREDTASPSTFADQAGGS